MQSMEFMEYKQLANMAQCICCLCINRSEIKLIVTFEKNTAIAIIFNFDKSSIKLIACISVLLEI